MAQSPLSRGEQLVDLSPVGKTIDPYHLFVQLVPLLAQQARDLRYEGATERGNHIWHSYRGFPVVASGFGVNESDFTSTIMTTGNLKASRHSEKVCAEKRMLGRLPKLGMVKLAGLVVAATSDTEQIRDIIGKEHGTLLPCADCTDLLKHDAHVDADMPIITVGLESGSYQTTTPQEIQDFYHGKEMTPLAYQEVPDMGTWWEHRMALYNMWAHQRAENPDNQPSSAVLARVAIGIQPELVLTGFKLSSRDAPELLFACV